MAGLPVVWGDTQLGFVEQAVADIPHGRLKGVVVRKGIGMARWCAASTILLIGRECVLLRQRPVRLPAVDDRQPIQAFLANGQWAGTVTDAVLQGDTLAVQALEITQGPVQALLGKRAYASCYRVCAQGRQVVVQQLLTWAQWKKEREEPT